MNREIENQKHQVSKMTGASCENCGQLSQNMQDRVSEITTSLEKNRLDSKALSKELTKKTAEYDKITVPISVEDFSLIDQLKNVETEKKVLQKELASKNRVLKIRGESAMNFQKRYDLLRYWEIAFSEQGLIKYIIRNILDFFNERACFYLSFLTKNNFSIKFDDSLTETIYNKGNEVFFESLSGGEKKKLSLATTLALNDLLLLSGKEKSNIVFFDEVGESLDEGGIKGLYDLMGNISNDKKVYVITHNNYLLSLLEDECSVLASTKKNNITKVKSHGV